MWHKPALLRTVADVLLALALTGVVAGVVVHVIRLPAFAIREVRVMSPLRHVTPEQIDQVVKRSLQGTFFTLRLDPIRGAFEQLPWVREVQLRRRWPARIEVSLAEHEPLARWSDKALVNRQGEVFEAAFDGDLPLFSGPAGAAKEMTIQFDLFRRRLAVIGKRPVAVAVSARRAWQIRLDDGLLLDIGRERIEERLERFVLLYPRTVARVQRPDRVDLRYANGLAVHIPGIPAAGQGRREKGA